MNALTENMMSWLTRLQEIVFDENASAPELLQVVLAFAVFWFFFFQCTSSIIRPLVSGRAWLKLAAKRDYDRNGKKIFEQLGSSLTLEEYTEMFITVWPWMQVVPIQHFVGGALCLPSVLGLTEDQSFASSLACLGILSEAGWEVQDLLTWIYMRYGSEKGRTNTPLAVVVIMGLHHSLTMSLGIPAILSARHYKVLHWLCCDLQFAGGIMLMIGEYTKLLNLSSARQLFQFKALTLIGLLVTIWARVIHWTYLCFEFTKTVYESEQYSLMAACIFIALLFSVFNWLFCIQPLYIRLMKFYKASTEYRQATEKEQRRTSLIEMEHAAAELTLQTTMQEELLYALFHADTSPFQQSLRRRSIPASMFGSASRSQAALKLRRASMAEMSRIVVASNKASKKDD